MNLWLPQSEQAKAECSTILSTTANFLSSQDSKPLIGLKQDGMTGGYLLTYGIQSIERSLFMEILTTHYFEMDFIFHKLDHIQKVYKHTFVPNTSNTYFQRQVQLIEQRIVQEREKLQCKLKQLQDLLPILQNKYDSTDENTEMILSYFQSEEVEFLQEKIRLKNTPSEREMIQKRHAPNKRQKVIKEVSRETLKESFGRDIKVCEQRVREINDRLQELDETDVHQQAEDELLYTGHSLFSVLLPDDFEYYCKNNMSPDGTQIYISRGVLLSGTLNKTALGNASGSMIHHLAKDYGNRVALEFVSYYEMMINNWLIHRGFSIGMADCIPKNTDLIDKEISKYMVEASAIMNTEKDKDLLEMKVSGALNKAVTLGQKIAKEALDPKNSLVSMIRSGAKGNDFNVTQVTGLVGQQNVSGQRMQKTFGGRTLPHFQRLGFFKDIPDILPKNMEVNERMLSKIFESRGFVRNSFYTGLQPAEFFMHAASGREGCTDSAIKTADTGYTQRKIIKMMEDYYVTHNHIVHSGSSGHIIEFAYGMDNMDASKLIKTSDGTTQCVDVHHLVTKLNRDLEWSCV